MPKLLAFRERVPDGLAVLSDASRMALASGSVDVVTCIAVMHHLAGALPDQMMDEAFRVLRVGGRIVLLDAVMNRERKIGRMLWRLDRGAFPRTAEELREKLERRFCVTHWEQYAVYHEYAFGIGTKLDSH
jgi:ubiquinone/menaquinone biosynthesis C-methylase UbiE